MNEKEPKSYESARIASEYWTNDINPDYIKKEGAERIAQILDKSQNGTQNEITREQIETFQESLEARLNEALNTNGSAKLSTNANLGDGRYIAEGILMETAEETELPLLGLFSAQIEMDVTKDSVKFIDYQSYSNKPHTLYSALELSGQTSNEANPEIFEMDDDGPEMVQ